MMFQVEGLTEIQNLPFKVYISLFDGTFEES